MIEVNEFCSVCGAELECEEAVKGDICGYCMEEIDEAYNHYIEVYDYWRHQENQLRGRQS